MMDIQQQPLGIAYGNVYPRQEYFDGFLSGSDGPVAADMFVEFDIGCGIVRGQFHGWLQLPTHNVGDCLRLQVGDDLHLEMSHRFGGSSFLGFLPRGSTFDHDKDIGFLLTAVPTFQRLVPLVLRELDGKEALVQFHTAGEQVAFITLAHDIPEFVAHLPNGLIAFVAQLAAEFLRGKGLLRARQQEHGCYPVTERQLAVLHDRPGTQGLPAMAVLALERQLVGIPAVFRTTAMFADNTGLFPLFLQISDTRRFIGEALHEIQYVHNDISGCNYIINVLNFSKIRKYFCTIVYH